MGPGLSLGASDLAWPLVGPMCQLVKAGAGLLDSPRLCSLYQGPVSGDSSPGHLSHGAFRCSVTALSRNGHVTGPPAPPPHGRGQVGEALERGWGVRAISLSSCLCLWGAFSTKVTVPVQHPPPPPLHESDTPGVWSGQHCGRGGWDNRGRLALPGGSKWGTLR